jgi:hypothetical protein
MMSLAQFADLVDRHGPDPEAWPRSRRPGAEALLAASAQARALLARAGKLDALLVGHREKEGSDRQAAGRVLARLAAPLPPQRSGLWSRLVPLALLEFDFAPAWPRFATLLAIGLLGFAVGLSDVGMALTKRSAVAIIGPAPASDSDLSVMLFEPDPLSTMR